EFLWRHRGAECDGERRGATAEVAHVQRAHHGQRLDVTFDLDEARERRDWRKHELNVTCGRSALHPRGSDFLYLDGWQYFQWGRRRTRRRWRWWRGRPKIILGRDGLSPHRRGAGRRLDPRCGLDARCG